MKGMARKVGHQTHVPTTGKVPVDGNAHSTQHATWGARGDVVKASVPIRVQAKAGTTLRVWLQRVGDAALVQVGICHCHRAQHNTV